MKYFIYCRRSQDREDLQPLSIDSQLRATKELAQKHGLQVVDTLREDASAYERGRPIFNEMMRRIESGEVDAILTFHLTRLSRNAADAGLIISFIDEGKIKEIRTMDTAYHNTADDKLVMNIHLAMAKKSSDDTSTFVKNTTKTKLSKGEFPGTVSYGYLNLTPNGVIAGRRFDRSKQCILEELGRPLKRVEKDPIDAVLIRKLMDMALTGAYTETQLREEAYKLGIKGKCSGKKLCKSSLHNILSNIFYTGKFRLNGKIYQGIHDPILTENEFNKIQLILKQNGRLRTAKHDYLFAGLLFCGDCGGLLSGDYHKGHHYYRCARTKGPEKICKENYCSRQSKLNDNVLEALDKLTVPESIARWSLKFLKAGFEKECSVHSKRAEQLHQNLQQEKNKLERLTSKWLSPENMDGVLISDQEYASAKQELQKSIASLNELSVSTQTNRDSWLAACEAFFLKLRDLRNHYESLEDIDKRILLKDLGIKMIRNNRSVQIEAQEPFNQILHPELYEIPSELVLESMAITKKDLENPQMNRWLPLEHTLRTTFLQWGILMYDEIKRLKIQSIRLL